jgi:hypothetical protein
MRLVVDHGDSYRGDKPGTEICLVIKIASPSGKPVVITRQADNGGRKTANHYRHQDVSATRLHGGLDSNSQVTTK